MWGDVGRCGEVWGDVERCGEMWGDVGRYGVAKEGSASRLRLLASLGGDGLSHHPLHLVLEGVVVRRLAGEQRSNLLSRWDMSRVSTMPTMLPSRGQQPTLGSSRRSTPRLSSRASSRRFPDPLVRLGAAAGREGVLRAIPPECRIRCGVSPVGGEGGLLRARHSEAARQRARQRLLLHRRCRRRAAPGRAPRRCSGGAAGGSEETGRGSEERGGGERAVSGR